MTTGMQIHDDIGIVLSGNPETIRMVWNNLTGKNIHGKEYENYLGWITTRGFKRPLKIALYDIKGKRVDEFQEKRKEGTK